MQLWDDDDDFIGCVRNYCSFEAEDKTVYKDDFRDNHI